MEVGRQHHAQQHLSRQIITALSFSACVEDVMRFPHVSFHICAVKSASTHDVSRSVPRTLSTFTLMRNLPNWHAGPSEGFKHQPTSRAVLCRRLHACFCWLSLTGELNFHLYNGGMSVIICDSLQITCNTFLCTVSFESLCVALILPPSHCACCECTKITNWGRARFTLGQIRAQTRL